VSLQESRDVAIIAYCIAGTLAFILIVFFTIVVGVLSTMTVNRTRQVLKSNVQPTLESVRQTSDSVRGTVQFASDYAIMPLIRTYATVAGAREFVTVLARLGRLRKGR
jgi:hypothetical protein